MADKSERVSIAWHPAFCSAAAFDLRHDKENLIFEPEHQLSQEPLRIDLLIIKKKKDEIIQNDIAGIFRQHNVLEYKSPDDGLTIDDYYKILSYASMYKATAPTVDSIPDDEVTISIFREAYPRKLMKAFTKKGKVIKKTAPGIYTLPDMEPFPVQIIVIKELDPKTHAGYRMLSKNVKEADITTFIEESKTETTQGEQLNIRSILEVSFAANQRIFEELRRRFPNMSHSLADFLKDEIEAAATKKAKEAVEKAQKEAAEKAKEAAEKAKEAAEKAKEAVEQAKKEAAEKAKESAEKEKEMAINLKKEGMDIDFIVRVTKTAKDVVEKWLEIQEED